MIMARNVRKGRGGRSKQVNSAVPKTVDAITTMSDADPLIAEAARCRYRLQSHL